MSLLHLTLTPGPTPTTSSIHSLLSRRLVQVFQGSRWSGQWAQGIYGVSGRAFKSSAPGSRQTRLPSSRVSRHAGPPLLGRSTAAHRYGTSSLTQSSTRRRLEYTKNADSLALRKYDSESMITTSLIFRAVLWNPGAAEGRRCRCSRGSTSPPTTSLIVSAGQKAETQRSRLSNSLVFGDFLSVVVGGGEIGRSMQGIVGALAELQELPYHAVDSRLEGVVRRPLTAHVTRKKVFVGLFDQWTCAEEVGWSHASGEIFRRFASNSPPMRNSSPAGVGEVVVLLVRLSSWPLAALEGNRSSTFLATTIYSLDMRRLSGFSDNGGGIQICMRIFPLKQDRCTLQLYSGASE